MPNLTNGQCAYRFTGANRCLELATTTRTIPAPGEPCAVYDVPLCAAHATLLAAGLRSKD